MDVTDVISSVKTIIASEMAQHQKRLQAETEKAIEKDKVFVILATDEGATTSPASTLADHSNSIDKGIFKIL